MKKPVDINRSQRLFIELGTPLHLEPEDPGRAISSELIGMRVGKYLIVRLSDHNRAKGRLKEEDSLLVKYICSDDIFGFNTRIIMIIEELDRLVFLDYPDEVESCNIRSHARIECFFRIEVFLEGPNAIKGVLVNINKQGCLCIVNDSLPQEVSCNSQITLMIPYARFDTLAISGTVKSIRRDGEKTSLGIMFDEIDTFSRTILTTLVPALKF